MMTNGAYSFEQRDNYLLIKASGIKNSTHQLLEGSRNVLELAIKFECNNILCDYREVQFDLNLSEAFNLVRIYENQLKEFKELRIAGLVADRYFELADFWEKISRKRGFDNKAFTTFDDAEEWLVTHQLNNSH
ncbi:hypothetical protein [Fulvivirga lutea]|uniref:Uncharacterized protein n=1 Tax=Fulvivirga lutea TaxID=2810512 RepID=A0A974WET6_9BACT|nr:hypothetical protein [Fulvivirga lutea]QSE96334.1 hypothetical protein JR347_12015 [Fulvivirga lutea]